MNPSRRFWTAAFVAAGTAFALCARALGPADARTVDQFHKLVQPILAERCADCHMDGEKKGGVSFDDFKSDQEILTNKNLWSQVLHNVRGQIMPPPKKPRLSPEESRRLADWIKFDAFGIDPNDIDPGRVVVRRLNRVEYRNTIRDLTGVDFDTQTEFPPDDAGYGFDNIGAVLNLSPMLLEKYLAAARSIIAQAVPIESRVTPEAVIAGHAFAQDGKPASAPGLLALSYYTPVTNSYSFHASHPGRYQLALDLTANERYVDNQFDLNQCQLIFKIDGVEKLRHVFGREGGQPFHFDFDEDWIANDHQLALELTPLTTNAQIRSLTLRIVSVTVRGPDDKQFWVEPPHYARFFPTPVPPSAAGRRAYARSLLRDFASRAFRRPVDDATVNRLADMAERESIQPGKNFESGVAQAMTAILASPRFLFREERAADDNSASARYLDDYSLASRLSYFLWSTMPDDELFRLAAQGGLRANLDSQVKRMLADPRAAAFSKNFTGQWLQARDVDFVAIDPQAVLSSQEKRDPELEKARDRFRELAGKDKLTPDEKEKFANLREKFGHFFRRYNVQFDYDVRTAMRREVELYFANIVQQDRSVLELLDSDYTYLNERLAKFYGLTNLNVTGADMRQVKLPPDSPRGGVLTMGAVLAVTSNPTRTSPVKRGLFVLDNILGNPVPPPPPNIPALEDVEKNQPDRELTLRETLAIHREKPLCSSCHNRMDPIGLAMENFNAMGMWRSQDHGQPIDCSGTLITGESFSNPSELKRILVANHRDEFYRTLTEKMLIYALGRGLEYSDTETVDQIVAQLDQNDGRFSVLLDGVIHSIPFQKCRSSSMLSQQSPPAPRPPVSTAEHETAER